MSVSVLPENISIPIKPRHSKKKYSKVNEPLKKEFLTSIIQNNMSIKEASLNLNINYSSAKAILATHRKQFQNCQRNKQVGKEASYKNISPFDNLLGKFSIACSTGGFQTSTFDQFQNYKLHYKTSIAPVILLKTDKEVQSSNHTENQCLE